MHLSEYFLKRVWSVVPLWGATQIQENWGSFWSFWSQRFEQSHHRIPLSNWGRTLWPAGRSSCSSNPKSKPMVRKKQHHCTFKVIQYRQIKWLVWQKERWEKWIRTVMLDMSHHVSVRRGFIMVGTGTEWLHNIPQSQWAAQLAWFPVEPCRASPLAEEAPEEDLHHWPGRQTQWPHCCSSRKLSNNIFFFSCCVSEPDPSVGAQQQAAPPPHFDDFWLLGTTAVLDWPPRWGSVLPQGGMCSDPWVHPCPMD